MAEDKLHPIDEEHEQYLRERFEIHDGDPIPLQIHWYYSRVKRIADRTGVYLDPRDLMWVCLNCGYEIPGDRPENFLDHIRKYRLEFGAPVICKWKKKEVLGTFMLVKQDKVIVSLAEDSVSERELDIADVRVNLEALQAATTE